MNEQNASNGPGGGFLARAWRFLNRLGARYSPFALVAGGMAAGVLAWGAFNWSMELSNTEAFCISCHEMRGTVYEELKETPHWSNRTGVRATCSDCHVPKPWQYKLVRKVQATNELFHKVLGTVDTPEKFEQHRLKLADSVWASMRATDSRECRNCHALESMNPDKQVRPAQRRHKQAREKGQTCIDCHQGIAHKLPKGWEPPAG